MSTDSEKRTLAIMFRRQFALHHDLRHSTQLCERGDAPSRHRVWTLFLCPGHAEHGLKTSVRDGAANPVPIHPHRRAKLISAVQMIGVGWINRHDRRVDDPV